MLVLRDYQIEIRNKIYKSMKSGHRRLLVCAPCGSGKTVIFCDIAEKTQLKGKYVLVLVHRIELLDQTLKTFTKANIDYRQIDVQMAQTYSRHLDKYVKPDLIITDEAHFSMANTWQKIYKHWPDVFVIGFSASPCRLDGKPLGDIYDDLIETVTTKELILSGYLAPYRYFAPSVADLSALNKKGNEFDQDQAEELLMTRAVFGDVLKNYKEKADNKKTVIYCTTIKHSKSIAEEFKIQGYKSEHIDGTTPTKERERIVERFRTGETKILCNVDIVSVGFDLPDIECCIMLRPTASTALFIQQAGRSLRPQPNKTAIILDHVGNYTRHGLPDDHREWSLNGKIKTEQFQQTGELKIKQCTECFFTFEAIFKNCPNCGAEIGTTREEIKQIESVRLEEIKRGEAERIEKYKTRAADRVKDIGIDGCKNLTEIMQWCKLNGKSSGWGYFYAKRKGMVRA